MEKKNDGGPAFPQTFESWFHTEEGDNSLVPSGMTLRQYYAGKFLTSMIAPQMGGIPRPDNPNFHDLVKLSIDYADALIREENKEV